MNLEEKFRVLNIARQRCCLHEMDEIVWMRNDGINVSRIGEEGIRWLTDQGVICQYDDEYSVVDRIRCIDLYTDLSPNDIKRSYRFSSDQDCLNLMYEKVSRGAETNMRLWMLFREIANAVRLGIYTHQIGVEYIIDATWFQRDVL